jgi:hypothetical protein
MISSAAAEKPIGTSMPSVLAVLRLSTTRPEAGSSRPVRRAYIHRQ